MKEGRLIILLFFCALQCITGQKILDPAFDKEVDRLIKHTIPIISVKEAFEKQGKYVFLDAREYDEYRTSHIPGARYIGYSKFRKESVAGFNPDIPVIIYCSVGYRSEKIAEMIKKEGFDQVYNLYGSIFEWANRGYPLENHTGQVTDSLHTYNRKWSRWVTNPRIKKVW